MYRFSDSFDAYGATADLAKKWAAVDPTWTWSATAGRTGAGAAVNAGGSGGQKAITATNAIVGPSNDCVIGFYVKISAPPANSTQYIWQGQISNGVVQLGLGVNTSGFVLGYGWNITNLVVYITGNINVCDNGWHYIEFRLVGNASTALYVDSISQGTGGGQMTGTMDHFQFLSLAGVTMTIDDVSYYDATTGAPLASAFPIGPRQITILRPVSDGTVQFTPSGGTTHFNLVNETVPDTTTYVSDSVSGHQDLYNFSALGYTPTNISGVVLNSFIENPNAGTINYQMACKNGATTNLSPSVVTPSIWQTQQAAFAADPNTGAAWTPAGLATAQFGVKVP